MRDTVENIFITGKAGTGKTTFLKYISEHINKQAVVLAPTGVAAINAGGETIHSFLQLPFSPFVPGNAGGFRPGGDALQDKHSLLAGLKLRDSKLKLIRKLDLIIIDEVSMVRCDLLDAIDLVLRHVRKNMSQPFGGIQMVFIGDLFQLPPVVPDNDWQILRDFYGGPYFFDSQVLKLNPPVYLELKKIYRQKEQTFIDILNNVRMGKITAQDLALLNERYRPDFRPAKDAGYITLSTHNRVVDEINRTALEELDKPLHKFPGVIKNDFNPKNLPTEQELQLKVGAQVMFVKNDLQTPRRYFNGKIGTVSAITTEGIKVSFEDELKPILLEKETWKNMRYRLNTQKGAVEEEEVGSFTQYPVRLAWAVTVHKSQGLTFDKVIVDLNRSFAPGQVYVALSRCTGLGGIVLRSMLAPQNIITDEHVLSFTSNEADTDSLDAILAAGKRATHYHNLRKLFSFAEEIALVEELRKENAGKKTGPVDETNALCDALLSVLRQANTHADSFGRELRLLIDAEDNNKLMQRKQAAANYFTTQVLEPCIQRIAQHLVLLSSYKRVLKQTQAWKEANDLFKKKIGFIKEGIE